VDEAGHQEGVGNSSLCARRCIGLVVLNDEALKR
jgi:hypothetical protein